MKSLYNYTQDAQTEAFNKFGAFFAFGSKQFHEKQKDGVKYVNLGAGLIAPKTTHKELIEALDNIHTEGVAQDIKENGIKKILWREFANYECQIVVSPNDAIDALKDYNIDKQTIKKEWALYWDWCVENDLF